MREARPFAVSQTVHTGITVSSLEESLRFWVDALGFRLMSRETHDSGPFMDELVGVPGAAVSIASVEAPGHVIELLEYTSPPDRARVKPRSCDVGSFHLGFVIDDLDAALERIALAGWRPLGEPQTAQSADRAGTRLTYVRGPDGTTVELFEPPRGDAARR